MTLQFEDQPFQLIMTCWIPRTTLLRPVTLFSINLMALSEWLFILCPVPLARKSLRDISDWPSKTSLTWRDSPLTFCFHRPVCGSLSFLSVPSIGPSRNVFSLSDDISTVFSHGYVWNSSCIFCHSEVEFTGDILIISMGHAILCEHIWMDWKQDQGWTFSDGSHWSGMVFWSFQNESGHADW